MDLKDFYGKAYQDLEQSFVPNQSLVDFLQMHLPVLSTVPPARVVLELGCGVGTHLLGKGEVWALDFSEDAISKARNDERFQYVNFVCQDACELELDQKFDLILDSHLLHCIVEPDQRMAYLKKVKEHLSAGGLFYVETMVTHRECNFEHELEYFFFAPQLQKGDDPVRFIDTAENIEKELKDAGFKILYFYIDAGKRMIPVGEREEALRSDPHVLRIIATKDLGE